MGETATCYRNEWTRGFDVLLDPRVSAGARCVVITGPVGAGKTSTLMKLAAWECAAGDKRVAIIDAAGKPGRLYDYAKALGCPFAAVGSGGLRSLPATFDHCDLVLIDTCAKSGLLFNPLAGGKAIERPLYDSETLLVLPADWPLIKAPRAAQAFRRQGANRMIITKLDKCMDRRVFFESLFTTGESLPLAFLSAGERIPFDIEPASKRRIESMLSFYFH